ncbi:MAG TPA: HEAT repeat domain-containing protein [Rhodanobacteraceae bacterium]|jgi:outer membrane protein assembly factor BamD (BamD/ComL family)|nr:HEAT repeat domain-containing protein [Rhodanobacteraceae bacterium]
MTRITPSLLAAAMVLALGTHSAAAATEGDMAPTDKAANQLYWDGQASLKKNDWNAALKHFEDLEKLLRQKEPKSADAALYWEAYTFVQAKRTTEAKNAIERLHREFPGSHWSKDADALLPQARPASTKASTSDMDDEELADIAVQGLMNAPPERALPLLKKVLQSQHPIQTKKRALFVLSQLGTDAALDVVIDTAKTATDPELRTEAVRMLGVSGENRAIERLRELYATSKDANEKRQIIEAWLVADRKDLVLASARNEPDPDVRAKAIETLGALDASDELKQLFDTTTDANNRRAIVHALGVAGNADGLAAIAGNAKLPEDLRIEALHSLGVAGADDKLVALYAQAGTPALRDATLQGLLIAGDADSVVQLYHQAKTNDEKKALLRMLSLMNDDEAINAIEEELDKKEKPR